MIGFFAPNISRRTCDLTDMETRTTGAANTLDAVRRQMRRMVVLGSLLGVLLTTGCSTTYDDARDAYRGYAAERAAAIKRLRSEAAAVRVAELGPAVRSSSAECEARGPDQIFGPDTVSCDADLWLIYTGPADGTSKDEIWAAEKTAVRALVDGLESAGWPEKGWAPKLDQSMADPSYDPYPLGTFAPGKGDVYASLYLVDRGLHRQDPEDAFVRQPAALQPADGAPFTVAVQFSYQYVTEAECDDCSEKSPTSWPK